MGHEGGEDIVAGIVFSSSWWTTLRHRTPRLAQRAGSANRWLWETKGVELLTNSLFYKNKKKNSRLVKTSYLHRGIQEFFQRFSKRGPGNTSLEWLKWGRSEAGFPDEYKKVLDPVQEIRRI